MLYKTIKRLIISIGCLFGLAIIVTVSAIKITKSDFMLSLMRSHIKTQWVSGNASIMSRLNLLQHHMRFIGDRAWSSCMRNHEPVLTTQLFDYSVKFTDHIALQFLFHEIFDKETYRFSCVHDKPFIIDCGSNIGLSILYFKMRYPQANVIGFEPDDITFGLLAENIKNNNLHDVQLVKKALSDHEGTITFYTNNTGGDPGMNMFAPHGSCHTKKTVPVTQLSAYIDRPVDFLKIDIEGAETTVLVELAQTGKIKFIKEMVIEYHHHMHDTDNDSMSKILKTLEDNGFGYQLKLDDHAAFTQKSKQYPLIYAYQKVNK